MLTYNGNQKVVTVAMLLAGPIIGLLYVVLMPIIGIATVVTLAVRTVLQGMYTLAAKSISFGWQPMSAYLAGKKKKTEEKKK